MKPSFLLIASIAALLTIPKAQATDVIPPNAENILIRQAITERIRDEFSKRQLDQKLKLALLNSAPTEDRVGLKSLIAQYQYQSDISFYAMGTTLVAVNKKGERILEMTPPIQKDEPFTINNHPWAYPFAGQKTPGFLSSLTQHLTKYPVATQGKTVQFERSTGNKAIAALQFLVTEASASNMLVTTVLSSYYFAAATQYSIVPGYATLEDLVKNTSVLDDPLRRGAGFEDTTFLQYMAAIAKDLTLSRYDVSCTASGATGYAQISGTNVKFISRPDLSVVVIPDKNQQAMLFEPVYEKNLLVNGQKVVASTQKGMGLKACKSSDCTSFYSDSNKENGKGSSKHDSTYRIAPNNLDTVVTDAIKFQPKNSPGSTARIEYTCEAKNSSCQSVTLKGKETLSSSDLKNAEGLVASANKALKWNAKDPSVTSAIERLRVLGACCESETCRKNALANGVDLKSPRSKSKGTTR